MRETDGYSSRRQTKAAFKRKVMDEIKIGTWLVLAYLLTQAELASVVFFLLLCFLLLVLSAWACFLYSNSSDQ